MQDSILPKILIVDDEPDIRDSLGLRLQAEGFSVLTADNGAEACQVARSEFPDCIILDLAMPVLDGHDTLQRLRGDTTTAQIPVIVLTASSDTVDKLITRNFGVEGYAIKPYDTGQLVEQIRNLSFQPLAI